MTRKLSNELNHYLERCGVSKGKIAQCTTDTRMYHDLGFYGETAEACISELADRYDVDLSGFEFAKYFPVEYVGKNKFVRTLLWIVPFASEAARRRDHYSPLTLDMIEKVMHAKRWSALGHQELR